MYIIYSPVSKKRKLLSIIRNEYEKKGLFVEERSLSDYNYLVVSIHPAKILKKEIWESLVIEEIKRPEELTKALRQREQSESIKEDAQVVIISGPYNGFKGRVKRLFDNDSIEVIVSIFGIPTVITVKKEDVVLDSLFKNFSKK